MSVYTAVEQFGSALGWDPSHVAMSKLHFARRVEVMAKVPPERRTDYFGGDPNVEAANAIGPSGSARIAKAMAVARSTPGGAWLIGADAFASAYDLITLVFDIEDAERAALEKAAREAAEKAETERQAKEAADAMAKDKVAVS